MPLSIVKSEKLCTGCKETKPLLGFNKNKIMKDGLQVQCKSCMASHQKRWQSDPKTKERRCFLKRIRDKNRRESNPQLESKKRREWVLKSKYGITFKEYNAMFQYQDGACAICETHEASFTNGKSLVIDHCHSTNIVRGLLCGKCNSMIGLAKEDIKIIKAAISYIEKHNG